MKYGCFEHEFCCCDSLALVLFWCKFFIANVVVGIIYI